MNDLYAVGVSEGDVQEIDLAFHRLVVLFFRLEEGAVFLNDFLFVSDFGHLIEDLAHFFGPSLGADEIIEDLAQRFKWAIDARDETNEQDDGGY